VFLDMHANLQTTLYCQKQTKLLYTLYIHSHHRVHDCISLTLSEL